MLYKGLISGVSDIDIRNQFTNNSGPVLTAEKYPGQQMSCGYTVPDESRIELATDIFEFTENVLGDKGKKYSSDQKLEALTILYDVILHEVGHELYH